MLVLGKAETIHEFFPISYDFSVRLQGAVNVDLEGAQRAFNYIVHASLRVGYLCTSCSVHILYFLLFVFAPLRPNSISTDFRNTSISFLHLHKKAGVGPERIAGNAERTASP